MAGARWVYTRPCQILLGPVWTYSDSDFKLGCCLGLLLTVHVSQDNIRTRRCYCMRRLVSVPPGSACRASRKRIYTVWLHRFVLTSPLIVQLASVHYLRFPLSCPQNLTSSLPEASLSVPLARVGIPYTTPGGTTACVTAGRLAAADPSLKILIVESGQHSRDIPRHVQPCRYLENLAPGSTTVSFHVAKPSPHLNGRATVVPCGRSVGGGSAVNCKL